MSGIEIAARVVIVIAGVLAVLWLLTAVPPAGGEG